MAKKKVVPFEGPPIKEIILGIIIAIETACAMLLAVVIPLKKIIDLFEAGEGRDRSTK